MFLSYNSLSPRLGIKTRPISINCQITGMKEQINKPTAVGTPTSSQSLISLTRFNPLLNKRNEKPRNKIRPTGGKRGTKIAEIPNTKKCRVTIMMKKFRRPRRPCMQNTSSKNQSLKPL